MGLEFSVTCCNKPAGHFKEKVAHVCLGLDTVAMVVPDEASRVSSSQAS